MNATADVPRSTGPTWDERIKRAAEQGEFTDSDRSAALCWRTCAIGEKHPPVGRVFDRMGYSVQYGPKGADPEVEQAYELGMAFVAAVETNNTAKATELLQQIEALDGQLEGQLDMVVDE